MEYIIALQYKNSKKDLRGEADVEERQWPVTWKMEAKDERQEDYLEREPEGSCQWVMNTPRDIRTWIYDWDPFRKAGVRSLCAFPS